MTAAPWKQNQQSEVTEPEVQPVDQSFEGQVTGDSALIPVEPEESAVQATDTRTYSTKPNLGMEEMYIPKLRLCQGQTPEVVAGEARPGQWILQGNEATDEVEVVVLAMGRAREYWHSESGNRDERELKCKSKDAEVGEGDPGGPCDACPLSQWTTDPRTQKRKMPACDMIYSYMVYIPEWGTTALLEMRRTGLNSARQVNTMIGTRGIGNFTLRLSGQVQSNGAIRYYIPKVIARPITPELREEARMWIPAGA